MPDATRAKLQSGPVHDALHKQLPDEHTNRLAGQSESREHPHDTVAVPQSSVRATSCRTKANTSYKHKKSKA